MFPNASSRIITAALSNTTIELHQLVRVLSGVTPSRVLHRIPPQSCRGARCERGSAHAVLTIASAQSTFSMRSFASRAFDNEVLANEQLVAALVNQSGTTADDILVRLIVALDRQEATSKIVPLSEAIQSSVEHQKDLIGIALKQEVPVVKVDCLKKLAYHAARKTKSAKTNTLPEKEFRFKWGIAESDMQRKVERIIQSLEKGHNCAVSIRCDSSDKDPWAVGDVAAMILERIDKAGELLTKIQVNENNRLAQFKVRPCSRK